MPKESNDLSAPDSWSLKGFLAEVKSINGGMPDRSFAFILGAGASRNSRIRTGGDLAREWAEQWHQRGCRDNTALEAWIGDKLGVADFTMDEAARYYSQIFEGRFRIDRDSGYAALENEMEGKEPSLGYSLLAEILQNTRHKVVVTTNFDNLVADALAIHAYQHPLVVGHESLAGFIRPRLRRPLVAKIHRDLFLDPINDCDGTERLKGDWAKALRSLFQSHTPIVLGYGGNDGSLMGLLRGMEPGTINGSMFWCHHQGDQPNETIRQVVAHHNGVLVAIDDFDEIMVLLAKILIDDFDIGRIAVNVRNQGERRAAEYQRQFEKMDTRSKAEDSESGRTVQAAIQDSLKDQEDWWSWQMRINAESDPAKQEKLYRQAVERVPHADLIGNFAWFMQDVRGEMDEAERLYRAALEADPKDARNLGNFAWFMQDVRGEMDEAERLYRAALEADPKDAHNLGNFANFMKDVRGEMEEAERLYRAALEADPKHANNLSNFAVFKWEVRGEMDEAERLFRAALTVDPKHVQANGNYANFMHTVRGDMDGAERLFRAALEADPKHANTNGNYARLLISLGREAEAAERIDTALAQAEKRHDLLRLECWFYRHAIFPEWCDEALAEMEKLLKGGVSSPGWDLSGVIGRARELGYPDPDRLAALAAAIARPEGAALPEGLF